MPLGGKPMSRAEGKLKRSRKNWHEYIREDIRCMGMTRREAIDLVEDIDGWRDCLARYAALYRMDKVPNMPK